MPSVQCNIARNMKNFLIVLFFFLAGSVNGNAQGTSIQDSLQQYLSEVQLTCSRHKTLWDIDLYGPILFVDPSTRKVFASEADGEGVLTGEDNIYSGSLPPEVNIANTSLQWRGKRWAMVKLPLPVNKNERLNLITHELFHRIQPELHFSLRQADNNHLDKKEGRIYLRLELEALAKAIGSESRSELAYHVSSALLFRRMRYEIFPGADSTENVLELNEGLAEYTGLVLSERTHAEIQKYLIGEIEKFSRNKSFVRSFPYYTIPAYGYLLRVVKFKNWNSAINENVNLTDFFRDGFDIPSVDSWKQQVQSRASDYNIGKIISEENSREDSNNAVVIEYRKKFVERAHLTIPFVKMNIAFDPGTLVALDDIGTVYPSTRITDVWGILTVTDGGALISSDWKQVVISEPVTISDNLIKGNNWTLQFDSTKYLVQRETGTGNFILAKK
jgi:hypothetical protein